MNRPYGLFAAHSSRGKTAGSTTEVVGEPRTAGRYQLLGGLQVLDVATTWVILGNFSARSEGNPVVASLISHTGLAAAMVALLVVKLAVVFVLYEKQTKVNFMSAIYGLVIFNNLLALGLTIF